MKNGDTSFFSEGAEWSVALEPIGVGERCSIIVSEDESSILLEDVLFGDVWFCSGQVAHCGIVMKSV